ncbi:IS1634 family transposase [Candidatus Bipolaricaulota bacterium]|nr:IS1634 family transposase [Candidatus Bipolaricaulota bacterium]
MSDVRAMLSGMNFSQAGYLPVVAEFCRRIGLADTINSAVPTEMAVDVGTVVQFMVLDTLSGRSPLYRLERFAKSVDTGLLLGRKIPAEAFNDTTLGRTLDAIYEAGTEQLFSHVAFHAARAFPTDMDMRHVHFDTTSVSVWGDYALCTNEEDQLQVTEGHSKDYRPDLKQFLVKMLCIHHNIPIVGGCENGNASDKTINNAVLTNLSKYMARHGLGEGAFVYIADSAMVTPQNLGALGDNLFITRLPFSYKEAERVVLEAVRKGEWTGVETGVRSSRTRKAAQYRVCDMTVTIAEKSYRAVVVHSDAHDKRRQKKLDRRLAESREAAKRMLNKAGKVEYFCREDAEAAAGKLHEEKTLYHSCECRVEEKVTYARGRPPKNGARKVAKVRYILAGEVVERSNEVERIREASGCFVLMTNTPTEGDMAHSPADVLVAYKEQHGIERNFGFLKDPLFVNDMFVKRPDRIEVLGFILLTSLLVWNLMEHVMREYLKRTDSTIPGWDRKPTQTPTSFMMTTKFKGVLVAELDGEWQFTVPLTSEQQQYVRALGLTEDALLRKGKTHTIRNSPGRSYEGWGM